MISLSPLSLEKIVEIMLFIESRSLADNFSSKEVIFIIWNNSGIWLNRNINVDSHKRSQTFVTLKVYPDLWPAAINKWIKSCKNIL